MNRRIAVAALAMIMALVGGCSTEQTVALDDQNASSQDVAEHPGIDVIETGAEPHVALRNEPVVGLVTTRTIAATQSITDASTGVAALVDVTMTFRDEIIEQETGLMIRSELTETSMSDAMQEQLETAGADIELLRADFDALIGESEIRSIGEIAPASDIADLGVTGDFAPLLPVTPVGIGARWTAESTASFEGTPGSTVQTWELIDLTASEATLLMTSQGELDTPSGTAQATGSGEVVIDRGSNQMVRGRLENTIMDETLLMEQRIEISSG